MPLKRLKKINALLNRFTDHPSQMIVTSFILAILIGSGLLMLPQATSDGDNLSFINALFTSTSAVCVTGLIVVDTATKFSVFGQLIIMLLIQIGGLGIMILSFFAAFIIGRTISVKEKITLSFMLNEHDMRKLSRSIFKIIYFTFIIEAIGMLFFFIKFTQIYGVNGKALLFSVFHAISAFCNAGFALFSDSFEGFQSDLFVNFVLAILIILGGLSFSVMFNVSDNLKAGVKSGLFRKRTPLYKLSVNTKVVLALTGILLFSGTLIIYGFEHARILLDHDLKTQYLGAFFQAVTLRTAGFNTLNISALGINTLMIMILFMFIGGASGSTAGGVKVNTIAVIYAYFKGMLGQERNVTLMKHHLKKGLINKAFMVITLSLLSIFFVTLILSMTEEFAIERILFEAVSAFGTVGLSTGITSELSTIGRYLISILMFVGRIGPLTLIVALSQREKGVEIKYPEGNIMIG